MGSTCKLCDRGLMARWCHNPSCSEFVDVTNASLAKIGTFYLNRTGVFRTSKSHAVLCSKCGRVLAIKALTNPCEECLSDPVRMEFEALKDEIQSSQDSELYHHSFSSKEIGLGDPWDGFSIEVLGRRLGRFSKLTISEDDLKIAAKTMPYPVEVLRSNPRLLLPFVCLNVPGDPDLIVRVLYLRTRYKNSALFAEKRFSPYGSLDPTVRTESNTVGQADYDKAQKALELLGLVIEKIRRLPGRPRELEGENASQIAETYGWLWFCTQNGIDDREFPIPTMMDVASAYKVHRVTLSNHIRKRLGTTWPKIKKQGIDIGKNLTAEQIPAFIRGRY